MPARPAMLAPPRFIGRLLSVLIVVHLFTCALRPSCE
jgi:hypothetical protein